MLRTQGGSGDVASGGLGGGVSRGEQPAAVARAAIAFPSLIGGYGGNVTDAFSVRDISSSNKSIGAI